MNIAAKIFCRSFQTAFRAALPFLPYREPEMTTSCDRCRQVYQCGKRTECQHEYPKQAYRHSQGRYSVLGQTRRKGSNPLYPVPMLMTQRELEGVYDQVAEWSNENDQ